MNNKLIEQIRQDYRICYEIYHSTLQAGYDSRDEISSGVYYGMTLTLEKISEITGIEFDEKKLTEISNYVSNTAMDSILKKQFVPVLVTTSRQKNK